MSDVQVAVSTIDQTFTQEHWGRSRRRLSSELAPRGLSFSSVHYWERETYRSRSGIDFYFPKEAHKNK